MDPVVPGPDCTGRHPRGPASEPDLGSARRRRRLRDPRLPDHYRTGGGAWTPMDLPSPEYHHRPDQRGLLRVPGPGGQRNRSQFLVDQRLRHPENRAGGPLTWRRPPPDLSQQVTITWDPPADAGGAPILDYALQYCSGGETWTIGHPAASVPDREQPHQRDSLPVPGAGPQRRRVRSLDDSPPATPRRARAPRGAWRRPADPQVDLTWAAPADNSGEAINDYPMPLPGPPAAPGRRRPGASDASVTGLTNGTLYGFRCGR